jgi:hypothetical protein
LRRDETRRGRNESRYAIEPRRVTTGAADERRRRPRGTRASCRARRAPLGGAPVAGPPAGSYGPGQSRARLHPSDPITRWKRMRSICNERGARRGAVTRCSTRYASVRHLSPSRPRRRINAAG